MISRLCLTLAAFLLCGHAGISQQKNTAGSNRAQIRGKVLEAIPGGSPIEFATVHLLPQGVYATTDREGRFEFKNIETGKTGFQIQFIGMETIDTTINLIPGKNYELVFKMKEANFRLDEVTVLATQSKAGKATASNISRQAMDHLQTSSLKDIMQLLPGVAIANPDLSTANQITIRSLSNYSYSQNMNSMGTAVIMDGSPLSNNANMQLLAPAISSATDAVGGGASPAAGVDLRSISTDNIEEVEVIRGIPSAEYGDLTSGAVLIRSKAGKGPLTLRFKTNPYTYQASVSKGLDLGKKAGVLNISGDYAYNSTRQTESYIYYQRLNVRALWSKKFGDNLNTNTSLDLIYGKDTRDKNPDDQRSQLASGARDIGFRFNTNGTWNTPDAGWLKNIRYNLSLGYMDKHSYYESLLTNSFGPYSLSMSDGTIVSNKPGQSVFDAAGNEITRIPAADKNSYATYLPNEYFSHYDIYGKELNFYAKIVTNFNKRWRNGNNNILAGIDYKLDGNLGRGIVYDPAAPPSRASKNTSYRPRAFSDIPFINQLGVFVEDSYTHSMGERNFGVQAGVRFDYINGQAAFSPRINAFFDILPRTLTLRGGYGIKMKAPSALYLYPQEAYFDYVNFNNLGQEGVPESEQLLVNTTRVFETKNKDLEIAKAREAEVGLDLKFNNNKMRFSVTAYQNTMKNGYMMGSDLSCFRLIPYDVYKIASRTPGGIPALELDASYNVFAMYNKPLNTLYSRTRGLEYELDLGRFQPIRTSFYISGAWMKSLDRNMNHSYSTLTDRDELERNIGVYEKGVLARCQERINTTFRITHNIPKIGFVITLTAQVDWKTKIWEEYGNDTMFEKYISYKDGKVYDFDPAMKDDPEFAYLFPTLNDNRFIAETYSPTLLFNLLLSKEIGNFLTASFFVNNLFNSRPLYESKRNPGSFTELGIPTFFGFDLKINIR